MKISFSPTGHTPVIIRIEMSSDSCIMCADISTRSFTSGKLRMTRRREFRLPIECVKVVLSKCSKTRPFNDKCTYFQMYQVDREDLMLLRYRNERCSCCGKNRKLTETVTFRRTKLTGSDQVSVTYMVVYSHAETCIDDGEIWTVC